MAVHLALTVWALIMGQPGKAPKPGAEPDRSRTHVVFLGRQDYKPAEGGDPLVVRIEPEGRVSEKFHVTDEMLKKWVADHCKGREKANIVIAVEMPDKTSVRAVDRAIEGVKKHVPKGTAVTFWIMEE